MVRIRYTAWDGTQRVPLTAERMFERLSGVDGVADDPAAALDWLVRQGFAIDGEQIPGLDALLDRLREALRERFRGSTLAQAFEEIRGRLDALRERLQAAGNEPAAGTSGRLSEAIVRLRGHGAGDPVAEALRDGLLTDLGDLRDLEEFARRYGRLFDGVEPLSFADAVTLMRAMEGWRALDAALADGNLDAVDVDALGALLGPEAAAAVRLLQQAVRLLWEGGFMQTREGRVQLSPKGVRRIGLLALRDIYQQLRRDPAGGHATDHRGAVDLRLHETRAYAHGDPLVLDLVATLKHGLARGLGTPLDVRPEDFEVYAADHATTTSTVLLLDMSWSMSWEGRFAAAKRVALAMESLVRTRFPRDYFGIVGFYTRAVEVPVAALPQASWNMGDPFTNLQDGLRLGARLLGKHPARNRQLIVVTDGQPTAYFAGGRLQCEWPLSFGGISARAAAETLREVERVTRQGIVINTFMLDDSPGLRSFVDRLTRINKGRALYTSPERLGEYVLVDYVARKRTRA
jgi:uncharacterized protein with von Willebrand factor type A (vWA) domain